MPGIRVRCRSSRTSCSNSFGLRWGTCEASTSWYCCGSNLPLTWNAGIDWISARTWASPTATPERSAMMSISRWPTICSSTSRFFSGVEKARESKASPCAARSRWRACSNWVRNSSAPISSRCQSMLAGHQCGASGHHCGGTSTCAAQVALLWVMYCSMPKNANGIVSNPRTVPAIQPEVLSRSFCSIVGGSCKRRSRAVYPEMQGGRSRPGKQQARLRGPEGWNRWRSGRDSNPRPPA